MNNKRVINDIIVSKKSIRQIPLSKEKTAEYGKLRKEIEGLQENHELPKTRRISRNPGFSRKPLNPKFAIWLIAVICLIALFFGISILFSSATVIITPRTEKIIFSNESYPAKLSSTNPADIDYEVLSVKQTASEIVTATEEKEVSQKASGKIVIYNNYSTAPQRLINNTRFEAVNGKVYRISSSVVVPGIQKVGGKSVPGSIEAVIYADQPGEDYNMKVSDLTGDFKIPGFKGDVRYQSFYARLKEDLTGGYIGKQRIVGADIRNDTEESLKSRLKEQLLKELYAIKPENYLVFSDSYAVTYNNLPDTAVDTDKAKISLEGNLNAVVFDTGRLSKYFAGKKISGFDNLATEFIPINNLSVTITGTDPNLWKNSVLQIKLNGEALIKWTYNADTIKRDLAGKKENDLKALLVKYKSTIKSIQVIFRPIWTRYFPDDYTKIRLQENMD